MKNKSLILGLILIAIVAGVIYVVKSSGENKIALSTDTTSLPTCTMTVSPEMVRPENIPVVFSWESENADYATFFEDIDPDTEDFNFPVDGSKTVIADAWTPSFQLYFHGAGGTVRCDATVSIVGSTNIIRQLPIYAILHPAETAKTLDGRFSITVDRFDFGQQSLVVTIETPNKIFKNVQLNPGSVDDFSNVREFGTGNPWDIINLRFCSAGRSIEYPSGTIGFTVSMKDEEQKYCPGGYGK